MPTHTCCDVKTWAHWEFKRNPVQFRDIRSLFQSSDRESASTLKSAPEGPRKNRPPGQCAATASKEEQLNMLPKYQSISPPSNPQKFQGLLLKGAVR